MIARSKVALIVGIAAIAALASPRDARADACKGTVVADDSWGTNSPSVRVTIRYSFSPGPVQHLEVLWELVGAFPVDAADLMLEELATGERADITLSELTAELTLGSCSKPLSNGNLSTFAREGTWGWDAGGSPSWEDLFDHSCGATESQAAVKACPRGHLQLKSIKLGLPARLTARIQKKRKGEAGAKEALAQGKYGAAIREADRALEADPDSVPAQALRAQATEKLEAAIDAGEAFMAAGNFHAAVEAYARASTAAAGSPAHETLIRDALKAAAEAEAGLGAGVVAPAGTSTEGTGAGVVQGGGTATTCTSIDNGDRTGTIMCSNGDVRLVPDTLSPEYQYALAVQQMHDASDQLAGGLSQLRSGEKKMLAIYTLPPALAWGASLLAESAASDGFSKGQGLMHLGVYLGPSLFGLGLSAFSNGHTRAQLNQDVPRWIDEARGRCDAGSLAHCREATSLARQLLDVNRTAGGRSDGSALWGPGPRLGPEFAFYSMAGVSQAGLADDDLAGTLTGLTTQVRGRLGVTRFGVGFESRFGDIDPTGEIDGAWSLFGAAGVQAGAGLLSPYAELRFGFSGAAGALESDDPFAPASPEIDDSFDYGLAIGNTFHFQDLFSTRGPVHLSLFADVAVTVPIVGALETGWSLTGGVAAYMPGRPDRRIDELGKPASPNRFDTVFVYGLVSGAGIEVGRFNGVARNFLETRWARARRLARDSQSQPPPAPWLVVSLVDVYGRADGDGLAGAGGSLFGLGYRHRFGSDWEAGIRFGFFGLDVSDFTDDPMLDLRTFKIGVVPSRIYVRRTFGRIAVEGGVHGPLLWWRFSGDSDGIPDSTDRPDAELYGGSVPGFLYAGVAL